jgi:hypothetical protein
VKGPGAAPARARRCLPPSVRPAMVAAAMVALAMVALASIGCGGLLSRDVTVSASFQVGGSTPGSPPTLQASAITQQLAAGAGDLEHLSSVTLSSVQLVATDQLPLDFVASGTVSIAATGLPPVTLATLPQQGKTGLASFTLVGSTDLRPYLAAGGTLTATLTYSQVQVAARGLRLDFVLHASLL